MTIFRNAMREYKSVYSSIICEFDVVVRFEKDFVSTNDLNKKRKSKSES